jgi:hypothetical protein
VCGGLLGSLTREGVGDVLRTPAVRSRTDLRVREELPAPRAGCFLAALVVVGEDEDRGVLRDDLPKLRALGLGDVCTAYGDRAPARGRQGVDVAFDEEDLAANGARNEQWPVPTWKLLGFGENVPGLARQFSPYESLDAPPMPKWDYSRHAVFVSSEQEPLTQLLAESASLPPFRNAGMAGKSPVASHCLLKIEVFLIPALAGLLARLGVCLWQLYAELPGQIQSRLDWSVEAAHGGPQVRDVAAEVAGETIYVIAEEMHGWGFVLVVGGHAAGLARAVGGHDQL